MGAVGSGCRNRPSAGELMNTRRPVVGLVAALLTVLTVLTGARPATAGAPNYECRAGSYRIGIDQHRRGGLTRVAGNSVRRVSFRTTDQNGPTLDLIADDDSQRLVVAVRGYGSTMTLGVGATLVTGACAFIPGNFVLGYVSAPTLVLRTAPDDGASEVARYRQRSLVWSSGRFDEQTGQMVGTPEWTRLRVVGIVRGGTPSGGRQQLGMGPSSGLDGASTIVEGWGRRTDVSMLGPPGP